MKLLRMWIFTVSTILSANDAYTVEKLRLSNINTIDDLGLSLPYEDASEICLPPNIKSIDQFTTITYIRARDIFHSLERNPHARNDVARGKCSYRRSYIQNYLRKLGISSGSLYIQCPSKRGRLRLIDQVTGRRYTFSNFHDANVVSVKGSGYQVMDVQFQDIPVSLARYLGQIEASQKLKPLRNRSSSDKGYCYWSIRN